MGMDGLAENGRAFSSVRERGRQVRARLAGAGHIRPRIVLSAFPEVCLSDRTLTIGGVQLTCPAFSQIALQQVKGAVVFFFSAGDFRLPDDPMPDQLLADMWGTAFAEALQHRIGVRLSDSMRLSDAFGPGYYGMDAAQIRDLARLADPAAIDLTLLESGALEPVKSGCGLFFEVSDEYTALDTACLGCRGASENCGLCSVREKRDAAKQDKLFICTGRCAQCGRCRSGSAAAGADESKADMLALPEDFRPETDEQGYAAAFDIGTTTVVGMLWDIPRGKLLASRAGTNPQVTFGRDVAARIASAAENPEHLAALHERIITCLNEILAGLCGQCGAAPEEVVRAVVCGNTAMSHLFAGYDPASLAGAPFRPAYTGTKLFSAGELGLSMRGDAPVMLTANIAGHVGGDISAGILATRMLEQTGQTLFFDIGTNGEIVFSGGGRHLVCSAAAGPAFEGAAIHQGMRAAPGAIDRVRFSHDGVDFHVLGGVPPIGISGSGLIDAAAELLRMELMDRSGRLASREEYLTDHPDSALAQRLRERGRGREFLLVAREQGEDLVLLQNDIREIQLAKGALAAGAEVLLHRAGSRVDKLDKVILAGAFGSRIDPDSALAIGLLPPVPRRCIESAGNAAGTGVLMAAASAEEALKLQRIPAQMEHVELAEDPAFQTLFLRHMSF